MARLSGNTNHTYTILDDDAEPTVSFVNTPLMAWENCTNAVIGVMLSEQSARTVSVDYATSPGTAVSPDDYTNMSGTLTWSPGESGMKTYAVPVVNDTDQEGGETFTNTLSAPFNCTIAGINPAAMVIVDDDLGAPMINNGAGVIDILMNSAVMNGNLVATGGVPTQVWVCWGTSDGGTNAGSWINKTLINISGLGSFSTNVTGLPANTLHHYRACASNEYGTSWGAETISFYTGPPTIQFRFASSNGVEAVDQLLLELELSDPAATARMSRLITLLQEARLRTVLIIR